MSRESITCKEARFQIMGLIDYELSEEQVIVLQAHIKDCEECSKIYNSFAQLKKGTNEMAIKKLPEMYWDDYWNHVYNRIERGFSWILISLGAMLILAFGSYEIMRDFYLNPAKPLILKIGSGVLIAGIIVLFVSVLREKLMIRKVDKYRSVER